MAQWIIGCCVLQMLFCYSASTCETQASVSAKMRRLWKQENLTFWMTTKKKATLMLDKKSNDNDFTQMTLTYVKGDNKIIRHEMQIEFTEADQICGCLHRYGRKNLVQECLVPA